MKKKSKNTKILEKQLKTNKFLKNSKNENGKISKYKKIWKNNIEKKIIVKLKKKNFLKFKKLKRKIFKIIQKIIKKFGNKKNWKKNKKYKIF